MPDQRLQKARETLPECYQYGDETPVLCYFCQRDITKEAKVRMGESSPRFECVTCTDCAKQPYPLAELSAADRWERWRRPSENAAEQLTSTAYRITQAQKAHDKAHGT